MSEREFELRVEHALRAPVATHAGARRAIMERVRQAAREGAPHRAFALPAGRSARNSLIGVALAAGIGSITTLSALLPPSHGTRAVGSIGSVVIGDSVVDRVRDTLRLVRLMFDEPAARQVSVVGDFNNWQESATPMVRDAHTGRWGVTIALHDGAHRYAIVVDNVRWVGTPHTQLTDANGRVYSLIHVARDTN